MVAPGAMLVLSTYSDDYVKSRQRATKHALNDDQYITHYRLHGPFANDVWSPALAPLMRGPLGTDSNFVDTIALLSMRHSWLKGARSSV